MSLIRKIKKWLFDKLLQENIKVKESEVKFNVNGEIDQRRCEETFNYLTSMIEEIEPEMIDKVHLYIIDIKKSSEGQFYIIDNTRKCYPNKFDNSFCLELYNILCKNNKYIVKDNSCFLNLESTEAIETFVKKIIENEIYNEKIKINPCQHYHFSKIKLGSVGGNPSFVRFYGIGCDETDIEGDGDENIKKKSIYELFESMLSECIGYIESPTDKNVINTYKIKEEYASKILKHHKVIANSELITEIAGTRYESEECKGYILFCKDTDKKEPLIQFEEIMLKSENIRTIRKYLEMAKDDYYLWAKEKDEEYYIYGIDNKEKAHEYTLLQFTGYRKWLIQDNNENVLFERKGEKYYIPDIEEMNLEVKKSLELLLSKNYNNLLDKKNIKYLIDIVKAAKAQLHGTMIVFAHPDGAEKLTNYFYEKNRGIKLREKVDFTKGNEDNRKKLFVNLSSIDGALIIDTNGLCHAIGVILDGIANEKCNMARGARYNSALTFVTNKNFKDIYGFNNEKCKVFVFSEDKTVNILPDDINKV